MLSKEFIPKKYRKWFVEDLLCYCWNTDKFEYLVQKCKSNRRIKKFELPNKHKKGEKARLVGWILNNQGWIYTQEFAGNYYCAIYAGYHKNIEHDNQEQIKDKLNIDDNLKEYIKKRRYLVYVLGNDDVSVGRRFGTKSQMNKFLGNLHTVDDFYKHKDVLGYN